MEHLRHYSAFQAGKTDCDPIFSNSHSNAASCLGGYREEKACPLAQGAQECPSKQQYVVGATTLRIAERITSYSY